MVSSRDSEMTELWLARPASPHTRSCYERDVERLRAHCPKPLNQITLGDLHAFAESTDSIRLGTRIAPPDAGRCKEPVRVLPAHALCADEPSRRASAAPAMRTDWRNGSFPRTALNRSWTPIPARVIGFCSGCCMPPGCGYRKPPDCFGGTAGLAVMPARSPCSGRTDPRGPSR